MRPVPTRPHWLSGSLLILGLTLVAYIPAMRSGFVWDDDANVIGNPALTEPGGLRRVWFEPGACPQYYPLTFTAFSLENRLWGLDPVGYHVVNVVLHAANALLLWVVLRRDGVPGGWLAAALFALHPIEVESVAWVSELKNTLSGLFALLSLWAYTRFDPLGGDDDAGRLGQRNWGWYGLSVGLFVLALLSKSVTAMLAPVLLLRGWWRRPRLTTRDLLPLAPYFVLGAVMGLNTARLEVSHVGAGGPAYRLSMPERLLVAGGAFWFYPRKIVAPLNLTFVYHRWPVDQTQARQWLPAAAAALTIAALFALRRRTGKGPLVAVLAYAVMLFPALGFLDVYPMRYSFVADHFQYHAGVALLALIAAAAARVVPGVAQRPPLAAAAALPILVLLGSLTWAQCQIYHDPLTLWNDTLSKNPAAWIAHENLGNQLLALGRVDEAIGHLVTTVELRPDHMQGYSNLGNAYLRAGDVPRAVAAFERGLTCPTDEPAVLSLLENNLGSALGMLGDLKGAVRHFRRAAERDPSLADARTNLGMALASQGHTQEAMEHLRAALRLNPGDARTRRFLDRLTRSGANDPPTGSQND
jgi:tetratricopeptide (TPR) repeat protein